jgi:hypothetical protein
LDKWVSDDNDDHRPAPEAAQLAVALGSTDQLGVDGIKRLERLSLAGRQK